MRVAVTGADGFVGRPTCKALAAAGHEVVAIVRRPPASDGLVAHRVVVSSDVGADPVGAQALAGADVVVHLAAKTHAARGTESEAEYTHANVDLTRGLAEAAVGAGVQRFVFISSIKVNGEATVGSPFTSEMLPAPLDSYGRSKAAAEDILRRDFGAKLDVVILRPPLMYGPRLRGNLARLFAVAERGIPLPLKSIDNSRDILSVFSFADLIATVVAHPAANGRTFLARDGAPISTPQLLLAIAQSLGRPSRLLPFPPALLRIMGTLFGRADEMQRLVGDLEINDDLTRSVLGWSPPMGMMETLDATAMWWKSRRE